MQRVLITIQPLSCWYSLESSHGVLSDEYPYARVSVISQLFLHHFVLAKLATSSIGVKNAKNDKILDYISPALTMRYTEIE